MIIDHISNYARYIPMHPHFQMAFDFILNNHADKLIPGRYEIANDNVFAIISEYDTISTDGEKMEAHQKYIDIQYWIEGIEKVGHDILNHQKLAQLYNEEKDYLLVEENPSYFSVMQPGMFAIYYPGDLHMPCIQYETSLKVKKVVLKVKVSAT